MDKTLAIMAHVARIGLTFGRGVLPPPIGIAVEAALRTVQDEATRSGQTIDEVIATAEARFPLTLAKIDEFQARLDRDAGK